MHRIGIDLGGSNIVVGIVNSGKILHKKSVGTPNNINAETLIAKIVRLCNEILDENKIELSKISSIGIGVPGSVNPYTGELIKAPNLGIYNINISHGMKRLLGVDVYVDNDANCAALGEFEYGAAKGTTSSITVTLGTGIGGGIILNGKIYHGAFFGAGEIGHHVIKTGGKLCNCGKKGCWEAYASATALRRIGGGKGPKRIFGDARSGDTKAIMALERYIEYLCEGLANISNIFQPEIIVIGGGISNEGEYLLQLIDKHIKGKIFDEQILTKFAIAELGNDAGVVGAAMLGEG
ncbi:MAG: ROK family protein [Defluviitaleaceae bacterium]|nr:ROK family protein [Defluviitaleaceae bacterium]